MLILDAGTGIQKLGLHIHKKIKRVDILLTHLHLDHIQGLGFFTPLYDPTMEVHLYGPASSSSHLRALLTKYLSPPLFPVLLRELPCQLYLHAVQCDEFVINNFRIYCEFVSHPGSTVGYQIRSDDARVAYIPDHEPALGVKKFPLSPDWTSGYRVAAGVDLLLHDAQYTNEEYKTRVGWGHSTIEQALEFAKLAKVKNLVTIHHDPLHNDKQLDAMLREAIEVVKPDFEVYAGRDGRVFKLPIVFSLNSQESNCPRAL